MKGVIVMGNQISKWQKKQRNISKKATKQQERDKKEIQNFSNAIIESVRDKENSFMCEVLRKEFKFGDTRIKRFMIALDTMRDEVKIDEIVDKATETMNANKKSAD
jgi:hypothetical protein